MKIQMKTKAIKVMKIHQFPDWTELYGNTPVESMPWYLGGLDPDLEQFINEYNITASTWLDVGTGPATQAAGLQMKGFNVTATDISEDAVNRAASLYPGIGFVADNILDTRLKKNFDYIFDRGCFHVFDEEEVELYIENILKLLMPGGYLLLKCFSEKQPETEFGPYRYSHSMIYNIFSRDFEIITIKDTIFHGDGRNPYALFCVLKRWE